MAMMTTATHAQNIITLGDSNTWLGGDNCNTPKGWTYWFKSMVNPTSIHSYARSGATWTCTKNTCRDLVENIGKLGDNNVIYNQVQRLIEDTSASPDIIIISAGTNDMWFITSRPEALSSSVDEAFAMPVDDITELEPNELGALATAVRYNVLTLQQAYPQAHIVLLTPMQSTSVPTASITQAGDIIEECGKRMDCTVIRLDKLSKVEAQSEAKRKVYTSDGTHTSQKGAKSNAALIAGILKNMLDAYKK